MLIKCVCVLLPIFSVSLAKNSSLTFVIDDTLSMKKAIDQVKSAANKIMDVVTSKKGSEIEDVLLVTFNDPNVVLRERTSRKQTLIHALNQIKVHNIINEDCPEYALSGIIKGLEESKDKSYLYVFTDASAKDHNKINEVKRLIEKKQSQVVIVLTGDCDGYVGEELGSMSVYYEIARASNGLVFRVPVDEVIDIVNTIPDIIADHRSVITSKVIAASNRYSRVQFTVDDKTEYVSIHTSGNNVKLVVSDKKGTMLSYKKTLWKQSVKMAQFYASRIGTYYAWVKGKSDITIVIYARTDFTFDHGFSEFVPKSISDASKQPIAGRAHHLSISVTDPEHTVYIKSAEILDINENLIKTLPLPQLQGNTDFYITEKFISPSDMFKVRVTGIVKQTGKEIRRISKTAIEPQIPSLPDPKAPEVKIVEGPKVEVDYGGKIVLTCKVSGYPTPTIWWTSADGTTVSRKSNVVELPYDYISYLNLTNVQHSGKYYCKAKNEEASELAHITVTTKSPFIIQPMPNTTLVKYGERKQIRCDIASSYPMDIQWKTPLKLENYSLSADKKVLTINSVDFKTQGRYYCEATLKYNREEKHVFSTNVMITNLAPPTLHPSSDKITVSVGEEVHIKCKISGGVPAPRVAWKILKNHEYNYKGLVDVGDELTIARAAFDDAGTYLCIARNGVGEVKKSIELIVQMPPRVAIEEGSRISVAYESDHVVSCKVVAYPLPRIEWRNNNGDILPAQETKTGNYITSRLSLPKIRTSGTYTCFAKNMLGQAGSSVDIEMTSPFVVHAHPGGVTNTKFGSKTDITCDVRSDRPIRIKWFFKNSSGVSEVRASDKYKLSATRTTLSILNADVASVGTYSCEVSLVKDEKQKIAFSTNVQIDNLAAPVLLKTHPKVLTVKRNDKVKIPCTVVAGNPPPAVSWRVMKKGEKSFRELPATDQELVIDSAALSDAGVYRCDAINVKGQAHTTTELVVVQVPQAVIAEGTAVTVPFGGTKEFTCHISAFPLPEIVWRDNIGNELHATDDVDNINGKVVSLLKVNNVKSSATYTCQATNALGEAMVAVQVSVLPPIHFNIPPTDTTNVKYEEPATILCDVESSFPLKINWYYQKDELSPRSEIVTSDRITISANERVLSIGSMNLDLVGKYTCEASLLDDENEKESYATHVVINDLAPPKLTYSNETITVMEGDLMSAYCIANGKPKPVVTWQFKSSTSDVFAALPDQGDRISVPKISYGQSGLYKCTATNALGQESQNINVLVHGQPKITNTESVYLGVTGDKVLKIPCEVVGVPVPTITWTNRGKVVTSGEKLIVNKKSLYIKNPTEKDLDNFTCEAKNDYGYDTKTFTADVSDFISYDEELNSNIYLKVGESTDIKCLLPHLDPNSIRWYLNGEKTAVVGTFYSIKDARFSNDGNYTCRLNTDEGSESLNYVVDVGYKPSFMTTPPATIDWKGNKEDILDCYVRAKPRVKVQWFYNGKLLDATMSGLAIFGWGQYTCIVSNVHDRIERTFNVTSLGCLINRTTVNTENIPLFIDDEHNSWSELATQSEFYTINENEMITLDCATQDQPDNAFKAIPDFKKIHATCKKEDTFIVNGDMHKINDLQCKEYVKSTQVSTNKPCMKNGMLIDVGFKLMNGFLGVYQVCYSELEHRTVYTKVVMSSVNRGNIVTSSFKHPGTKGHGAEVRECAYGIRRFINPEDVAFGPAQSATLSDYNTISVYEPCGDASRLSWSNIEKTVASALYSSDVVTVWTGGSQYDTTDIPRYLWKVVLFDDDTFETIVYVNMASPNSSDILCPETIADRFTDVTDAGDQYTYICSMDDFLEAFKIPLSEFTST